jgi:hypothetical protein
VNKQFEMGQIEGAKALALASASFLNQAWAIMKDGDGPEARMTLHQAMETLIQALSKVHTTVRML